MPVPKTEGLSLESIAELVLGEPGLIANVIPAEIQGGADAARLMNEVIADAMEATGVNDDGQLTPEDLYVLSAHIRADAEEYAKFVEGHGDDEGNEETGFHLVQGDGGAYIFQGRDFIDTVADAIYHIGFPIVDGRFENEDGDANEKVTDVAGWMNYFVNGENWVYGTDAGETLHSGHYSFVLAEANDEIYDAGAGDDRVWAGIGNDWIYAGAGNDRAGGGEGNDRMFGDAGNDQLWGEDGNDRMSGGEGDDTLGGGEGNDRGWGGAGNDRLHGDEGNDLLSGGEGNDTIGGGEGDDTIKGGTGNDKLWGEDGADMIRGGDGDDSAGGGDGDDVLILHGGNDEANGEDGDDLLRGGRGEDTMWGGDGNDTLTGGDDDDHLGGQEGDDILYGNTGDDTLRGGEGKDELLGGKGDDSLRGDDGNDIVRGAGGSDAAYGGDGNDTVSGGDGNDTVSGGEGVDIVIGGAGADEILDYEDIDARDIFVFRQGDSGLTADTMDVIKGFTSIIDKLDLTDFGGLAYVDGTIFSGTRSEVLFDGDHVQIDSDGDGAANEMIELRWVNGVEEADFIL
ncbi:MAG: hypothetical protein AAGF36_03535 [Pseudomonadota bacterium]